MHLPDDVLAIIREYSKPLTRPDWRTCCRLSGHLFYTCLNSDYRVKKLNSLANRADILVLYKRIFNYLIRTHWGEMYTITRLFGIQHASIHFETTVHELYKIPGILHAHEYYTRITHFYNTLY